MKVSDKKGIANQIGPESCVAHREVRDEALTGEPAGQPLSREIFKLVQGADAVSVAECNTDRRVKSERLLDPAWSKNLACRYTLCTGTGRSPAWPLQLF